MEGDIAPVTKILAPAERCGAGVIVDEAHATGVQGPQAAGLQSVTESRNILPRWFALAGKRPRAQGRL